MRRVVVIVPGLLSKADEDTFMRQTLPSLSTLAEISTMSKVVAIPATETPEAMIIGLSAESIRLRQGPLTVSALGFDPPERSNHFHLSLMSFNDGLALLPTLLPTVEEVDRLMMDAKRLDTKSLTVLAGEGFDHGLVWEFMGDFGTTPATDVSGKPIANLLPDGDGEQVLRRFIDDSINLLTESDVNKRRVDEGHEPFNLLWPWGHGTRTPVPNLALQRGEPATVESSSMRLEGLTRLAGYRHGDRRAFGNGMATKLRQIADRARSRTISIVYIDTAIQLRTENKPDELDWFVRELDRELVAPLLEDHIKAPSRLSFIAPGAIEGSDGDWSIIGLALSSQAGSTTCNTNPFDERSLDERTIPTRDLPSLVEEAVLEPGST